LELLRAWALREVQVDAGDAVNMDHIAKKLKKVGGGAPGREAVRQLFDRIDADKNWFPGKRYQVKFGPDPLLTKEKRRQIARSAMQMKENGLEPTYTGVLARCPAAAKNPSTGKPFSKDTVYGVFNTDCHDKGSAMPWKCESALSRTALPAERIQQRLQWARRLKGEYTNPGWFFQNLIWTDLCYSILPGTEQKASEQACAKKGIKRWRSDDAKEYSRNLRPRASASTQAAWGDTKVFWAPVLTRGKFHVIVLDDGFPGENAEGAATLVAKIPGVLATRFPSQNKPKVLFTDRGKGFYTPLGPITKRYAAALKTAGLRAFAGQNASGQPPDGPDLFLHENAVAWVKQKLVKSTPRMAWKETREEFGHRMRDVVREINARYDVDGLCKGFPARLDAVLERGGDRLSK